MCWADAYGLEGPIRARRRVPLAGRDKEDPAKMAGISRAEGPDTNRVSRPEIIEGTMT